MEKLVHDRKATTRFYAQSPRNLFERRKINDAGQYDLRINLGLDPGHAGIVCKTESNAGRRQSASIRYGLTRSMQVAVFKDSKNSADLGVEPL